MAEYSEPMRTKTLHRRLAIGLSIASCALSACSREPVFVEPPGAYRIPSLAGCTFTRDAGSVVVAWEYDEEGRLVREEAKADEIEIVGALGWDSDGCLSRHTRSSTGPYNASSEDTFVCDSHGNWISWTHSGIDSDGNPLFEEIYRFENVYRGGRLSETSVRYESASGEVGLQFGAASYLWYDEERPLEVVYQNAEGTNDTATWFWDHDRNFAWDRRGASEERAMFRAWEGQQLVSEIHTEEEEEILSYEYSYADKHAPFPDDLWVSGDTMPPPTGLPRPQTLEELIGDLFGSNSLTVRCGER